MSHSPLPWLVREVTAGGELRSQWVTEEVGESHCQRAMGRWAETERLEEVRMQLHPIGSR